MEGTIRTFIQIRIWVFILIFLSVGQVRAELFQDLPSMQAAEPEVHSVFTHDPITPGNLVVTQGFLVASINSPAQILIYNPFTKSLKSMPGVWGNVEIAERNGWVGICGEGGQAVVVFHVQNPDATRRHVRLPPERPISCFGLDIEATQNRVRLWIGSTGDRRIYSMDLISGAVNWVGPVSGPFKVRSEGAYIFTVTDRLKAFHARPLIIQKATGKIFAGNPMGEDQGTNLSWGYASFIQVGTQSPLVYYLHPWDGYLHGFPKDLPLEEKMEEAKLSIPYPYALAQSGTCLITMGRVSHADGETSYWQLDERGEDGMPRGVGRVFTSSDPRLYGARRIAADEFGNVYIATFKGIFHLKKMLEPMTCH